MTSEQKNSTDHVLNASELVDLSNQLIYGIEKVYQAAVRELQARHGRTDSSRLPGVRKAVEELQKTYAALRREPFLARVEVQWEDTGRSETLYVCRGGTGGLAVPELDGKLVSYRAVLGKLAELDSGEDVTLRLPGKTREAVVTARVKVKPKLSLDQWDGVDNLFDLPSYRNGVESLRSFIAFLQRQHGAAVTQEIDFLADLLSQEEDAKLFFTEQRRKTVLRMELRDQPILDRYQGEVFRLPLDRQLLLLGPPGTGKTTTLIKRLAQKRTPEALTPDEEELLSRHGLSDEFRQDDSWMMFSPTDLLKLYVREAFARESVPAMGHNLRTWNDERRHLGRDVFKFLRSGDRGRFTISEQDRFLISDRSDRVSNLFDSFTEYVDESIVQTTRAALEWMETSGNPEAGRLAEQVRIRLRSNVLTVESIHALADQSDFLQSSLESLRDRINNESRTIANGLVGRDTEARLQQLDALLKEGADEEDTEDDSDEDAIDDQASERARLIRRLLSLVASMGREQFLGTHSSKRSATRLLEPWLRDQNVDHGRLKSIGEKVLLEQRVRDLHGAARRFVARVPSLYSQFRRHQAALGEFYVPEAAQARTRLAPSEVDVILLAMLRNAERAMRLMANAEWLANISPGYLMQVYVDEATDFSAVELACMLFRTHPRVRSWFACGDFRQRLTGTGIRSMNELEWVRAVTNAPKLEIREVASNYRQSQRLSAFAKCVDGDTAEPLTTGGDDPSPLLVENIEGSHLGAWLASRIREIESHVGRLPSIGIFVDSEERIDKVVEDARPFLAAHNIKIVACREGRDVGQRDEVRVFDIKHIKGLEFEAVFFVGIDKLAESIPDLLTQYMYVGVTRAASFLAICCEKSLPPSLDAIRTHASATDWSREKLA